LTAAFINRAPFIYEIYIAALSLPSRIFMCIASFVFDQTTPT
jgi:hypothetical protein